MRISIVTPSFRQPDWLRLCLASTADQKGVEVEHIVQDNNSGPAVRGVMATFPGARLFEETDQGMYDAVNRGLKRSAGEICAYLNCDEQYLPGTLGHVAEFFSTHPEVDVMFGDVVVVDTKGGYLCSRQVLTPRAGHTRFCHLNTLTAATFFRRTVVDRGLLFDPQWRAVGDAAWVLTLLQAGVRMAVTRSYLAAFMETGANEGRKPSTLEEEARLRREVQTWRAAMAPWYALHHRLRRWSAGLYRPMPFEYQIHVPGAEGRKSFTVEKSSFLWPGRFELAG